MKYPTVSALCEGVAGAIRAKEGSTEKINPQDFVQRIDNLEVGGGTDGGSIRSSWRYFDVSKMVEEDKEQIVSMFALIIRAMSVTNDVICPPKTPDIDLMKTLAFGFDSSMPYRNKYMEEINTIGELYAMAGGDEVFNELGIIEISEEEFLTKTFE